MLDQVSEEGRILHRLNDLLIVWEVLHGDAYIIQTKTSSVTARQYGAHTDQEEEEIVELWGGWSGGLLPSKLITT